MKFISNWSKDEIKEYHVSKLKTKIINDSEVSRKETNKIIGLEILDSKKDSFIIEWNEYPEKESKFEKWIRKIFKFRVGEIFTIKYKTTKFGVIDEFIDTNDLDNQIKLIKDHIKPIGNTEKTKEFIENSIDEELISARLLKALNIFHFPYDDEYSELDQVREIQVSNHLMKENKIPVELINSLIYYDELTQISEIQIEKKYHQSTYNRIIRETIGNIDQQLERNRNMENVPLFVGTERFWYKVNVKTGWIINAKYEKVFMTKEGENIEKIEINSIE